MSNPSQKNYNSQAAQPPVVQQNLPTMQSARQTRINKSIAQNTEIITYATTEVNKLAGEDKVTIPEKIFVKYFLPYFAQEEESSYPPSAKEEWFKISKNGIAPVTVVDEQGNDVVQVPAKYSRGLINIRSQRDRVALSDAMATFSDLAVSSPIRAKNYFDNVINPNTSGVSVKQEAITRFNEAMDKVLIHYGKKTGLSNTKISSSNKHNEKPKTIYAEDDLL